MMTDDVAKDRAATLFKELLKQRVPVDLHVSYKVTTIKYEHDDKYLTVLFLDGAIVGTYIEYTGDITSGDWTQTNIEVFSVPDYASTDELIVLIKRWYDSVSS